jgi:hypothetical protein
MFAHYARIIFIDTEETGITGAAEKAAEYLDMPMDVTQFLLILTAARFFFRQLVINIP